MGCDIHAYKEQLIDGKWEIEGDLNKVNEEDDEDYYETTGEIDIWRNYNLFGLLAGVRSDYYGDMCLERRGIPDGISKEVDILYKEWEGDAHSESWLGLQELKDLLYDIQAKQLISPFSEGIEWTAKALVHIISEFDKTDNEQRLVFWFDN